MLRVEADRKRIGSQGAKAKELGAYYTDNQIADFLAWWALRTPGDTVMDPSFGGGVFLGAASERLRQLGGDPGRQVYGVEIDIEAHRRVANGLAAECSMSPDHLRHSDFFKLDAQSFVKADAIIGNPPYIRYQRFSGALRKRALSRSADQGVCLPELSSSWAPFLVHCISMLRTSGRLAMVLPFEIGHAKYARPVLDFMYRSFGTLTFLTFRKKLFPDLSEATLLLLADDKGAATGRFLLRDLAEPGQLRELRAAERWSIMGSVLDAEAISSGRSRLIEYLIPEKARRFYQELKRSGSAQRLGDLADVGIGYVTGANDYFHLGPEDPRRARIPEEFLKPAVRRGRALSGLRFSQEDWQRAVTQGEAGLLLHIKKGKTIPASVRAYVELGESRGVHQAYKCRTRSPWYCVPHVHRPDAFLTYMSGATPRLVANDAGAYAPNSLHVLRLHPLAQVPADAVAALWQTSLTRLSVEIEGHALGGGMLKLEPTEAENVLIPSPSASEIPNLRELAAELDRIVRRDGDEAARSRADQVILKDMLGLSRGDCDLLITAAVALRRRRGYGESTNGAG